MTSRTGARIRAIRPPMPSPRNTEKTPYSARRKTETRVKRVRQTSVGNDGRPAVDDPGICAIAKSDSDITTRTRSTRKDAAMSAMRPKSGRANGREESQFPAARMRRPRRAGNPVAVEAACGQNRRAQIFERQAPKMSRQQSMSSGRQESCRSVGRSGTGRLQ